MPSTKGLPALMAFCSAPFFFLIQVRNYAFLCPLLPNPSGSITTAGVTRAGNERILILNITFWGWNTNVQRGYLDIRLGLAIQIIPKNLRWCGHGSGRVPQSNKFGNNKTKQNTTYFSIRILPEMHNMHQYIKGYEKSYSEGAFLPLFISAFSKQIWFFPSITLVNILDEHMPGNIALGDYSRDYWSPM